MKQEDYPVLLLQYYMAECQPCDYLTVVITNLYINDNTCLNKYNNKFILEYNYSNNPIDLALATVVHYGLRSQ